MCPVTGAQRRRESSGSREVWGKRWPIWLRAAGARDDASCSPTVALDNNHRQQNKGTIVHVTPCECESPGWCQRHKCQKSLTQFRACQRIPGLFALWEQGRGPGQAGGQRWRKAETRSCKHRGVLLRTEQCPTCQGQVGVKVFTCQLHTECTIAKQISGAACCGTCRDCQADESTSG